MTLTDHEKLALEAARLAQACAHAPYSGKQVGAAVITVDGMMFAACNVENSDSTLRVCAERNAVAQAISAGNRKITAVVVIAPDERFWPPCEACRAVIAEFVTNPRVIMSNRSGRIHVDSLNSLPMIPFSANGQEPVL
jgi:cytidine deaminase